MIIMKTKVAKNFRIETNRLFLCLISLDFCEDIFREFTEEVALFLFNKPTGKISDTKKFIIKSRKETLMGNNLQLIAVDKENGQFLGCLGIHKIKEGKPEMGLWFKKSSWRNGYGKEAMLALKKWAKDNITCEFLFYPAFLDNLPSRKIAEFLGGKIKEKKINKNIRGDEFKEIIYIISTNN